MPRSSVGADEAQHAGISKQKRMRKGTKSCLNCRRRKIRCSGISANGSCPECTSRDDKCLAQGILAEDDATINKHLRERVAYLEERLRAASGAGSPDQDDRHDSTATGALRRLLSEVDHDGSDGKSALPSICDRAEEEVETSQAPLMKLLSNPVFGATSTSASSNNSPDEQPHAEAITPRTRLDPGKDRSVLRHLCSYLPSEAVMADILENDSGWWPLYRETLGFYWGGDLPDLRTFAAQALNDGHPPAVALLLICFAIGTGELERYLPPVERHILYDDHYAATEYGLNCLMALGLCYMSALQPRRTWTVYRRANTLLQLNGLHLQHRSERQELMFWQLFHADRWVSLMIGLPYMAPDHLCQLTIAPIDELGAGTWLYRQLGILTGRVIDCMQNVKEATLSTTLEIEEQLENIRSQLPFEYMDVAAIRTASDTTDRFTRLYRVVHYYQLKATLHLPFFLRSANEPRYEYSRKTCIDDSRHLLEAFLEIFDSDPMMICYGTILSFTALTASVVLILGIFRYGLAQTPEYVPAQARLDADFAMILRVKEAIKFGSKSKVAGLLCSKCYSALESMTACAYDPVNARVKRIVLPYFGTLILNESSEPPERTWQPPQPHQANTGTFAGAVPATAPPDWPAYAHNAGLGGISMTYDGPFMPENDHTSWMLGLEQTCLPDAAAGVQHWHQGLQAQPVNDPDWSWLFADLPPMTGL